MSEPPSRADEIRRARGTSEYLITVTGTKRHTGKTVPLRRFSWNAGGWGINLDDLYKRLGGDDPEAVDKVLSAVQSQRHGRPTLDGTARRIGDADVPIAVLNTILNALREVGRHSVGIDDVKTIVSEIKTIEKQADSDITELSYFILPGFPGYAEQEHARKIVHAEILKRCTIG